MSQDFIEEIGIDDEGRLYVCPATATFDRIYRAAMDVHWGEILRRLRGPVPRRWSYDKWFAQILTAASDEYAIRLLLTPETNRSNVPIELQATLQAVRM